MTFPFISQSRVKEVDFFLPHIDQVKEFTKRFAFHLEQIGYAPQVLFLRAIHKDLCGQVHPADIDEQRWFFERKKVEIIDTIKQVELVDIEKIQSAISLPEPFPNFQEQLDYKRGLYKAISCKKGELCDEALQRLSHTLKVPQDLCSAIEISILMTNFGRKVELMEKFFTACSSIDELELAAAYAHCIPLHSRQLVLEKLKKKLASHGNIQQGLPLILSLQKGTMYQSQFSSTYSLSWYLDKELCSYARLLYHNRYHEEARQLAGLVEDPLMRFMLEIDVYSLDLKEEKIDAAIDYIKSHPQLANRSLREELIKKICTYGDLIKALRFAQSIANAEERDLCLVLPFDYLFKLDTNWIVDPDASPIDILIEAAHFFCNKSLQNNAFAKISAYFLQRDMIDQSISFAKRISEKSKRDESLKNICEKLIVQSLYIDVDDLLPWISSSKVRDEVTYKRAAKRVSYRDIDGSLRAIESAQDKEVRSRFYQFLAKELLKDFEYDTLLRVASQFPSEVKDSSLFDLCMSYLRFHQIDKAQHISMLIIDPQRRSVALEDIAQALLARGKIIEANSFISKIPLKKNIRKMK